MLARLTCLVGAWQWTDKLGAWPACQNASLSGPTAPTGWAGFGQIWQNAEDRNDALQCAPLPTGLVSVAGMLGLPCGCMAMA